MSAADPKPDDVAVVRVIAIDCYAPGVDPFAPGAAPLSTRFYLAGGEEVTEAEATAIRVCNQRSILDAARTVAGLAPLATKAQA